MGGSPLRYVIKSLFLFLFITSASLHAQNRYWVFFKDKADVTFNPYDYFDIKAIERRLKRGLPLCEKTDLPLNETYIDSVINISGNYGTKSRWMNAMTVKADNKQVAQIANLDCVTDIHPVNKNNSSVKNRRKNASIIAMLNEDDKELLMKQTAVFNSEAFEKAGIDGSGIRIAVFDGGFPGVDNNPVFEHLRKENRIIKTYDFVKDREFVYAKMAHGTMVLSCIAGIFNGQKMGLATGAEFLLARTEVRLETLEEEENWLAAVEWADKNGADIINSSLGYTYHRYFSRHMDGKTTLVSRAANLAAKKGILVINAMGNDGNNRWEVVGAPADADSVLSVGGIDPESHNHIYFSSFGPTADKRMKPNLSAYGEAIVADKKKLKKAFGTSFAAPLITGFAACAWQMNPDLNNMEIFEELQKAGSLYPYFDYAHGYGIPKTQYFTEPRATACPTFEFDTEDGFIHVKLNEQPDVEKVDYVYYHIKGYDGVLNKYAVIVPVQKKVLSLPLKDIEDRSLTVHYKGYTEEIKK